MGESTKINGNANRAGKAASVEGWGQRARG